MIYVLVALVCTVVWFGTRRVIDPLRRVGVAIAAIGIVLAVGMWWMAFPFLIIAGIGAVVAAVSYIRPRRAS